MYDGSKCSCKKCPNFTLCKVWAPAWVYDCHSGRCHNCNASFAKDLVFQTTPLDCPICHDTVTLSVKHPAGCEHATCIACFKEMWNWDVRDEPQPQDYGLAKCECCDDYADTECTCDADDAKWRADYPEDVVRYKMAVEMHDTQEVVRMEGRADPRCCPMCRANVRDDPSNSWNMRHKHATW